MIMFLVTTNMQTILEIVGSTVIGGMLLLLIFSCSSNVSSSSNSQLMNSLIQSDLTTITEILEADIKNMGYRIPNNNAISVADSNRITFKFANDITSTIDSISYYFVRSENCLYRKFKNNAPGKILLAISNFNINFYDINGSITSSKTDIKTFKVSIAVQDTFKYDGDPVYASWVKTFKPQNL